MTRLARRSLHQLQTLTLCSAAALALAACADSPTAADAGAPVAALADRPLPPVATIAWRPVRGPENVIALIATRDAGVYAASETDGLFHSADEGETWQRRGALPDGAPIFSLAKGADDELYAGSTSGIYRSDDGGASWKSLGLAEYFVGKIATSRGGRLFAAAPGFMGGVFRSDDAGATWTRVLPALNPRDFIPLFLTVNGGDVFLGTHSDNVWRGLSGGDAWEPVWGVFEVPDYLPPVVQMIATPEGTLLATWANGVLRSPDQGATWKPVLTGGWAEWLTTDASGALYATTPAGSVFRSTDDGISWRPAIRDLRAQVTAIAITPTGHGIAASWDGIYRSTAQVK